MGEMVEREGGKWKDGKKERSEECQSEGRGRGMEGGWGSLTAVVACLRLL